MGKDAIVAEPAQIKTSAVQFESAVYPRTKPKTATIEQYADALRAGDTFPAIKIDANGSVLLDGYHRWKAHVEIGAETILASTVQLNGMPRKLYAAGCNAIHGDRLTNAEKKDIAREMYAAELATEDEIGSELGVSQQTVSSWVSDIRGKKTRSRDSIIWWLHQLGWTQAEIGEQVGLTQQAAAKTIQQIPELVKVVISQHDRGRSLAEIATAEGVDSKLIEALLLNGKDDAERMEALKCGIQPYDVWTFSGCDERFGASYPGRIPGQLLLHVLYFFTKPGDLVIDPMAGSGTTIDACAYMGRRVYGYDAHPARDDILEHGLGKGWPDRTAQAKLIFWDPPYYKKKDDEYGEDSVSRLEHDDYLRFFKKAFKAIPETFKGIVAFLCSDYNDEKAPQEDIFYWEYVSAFLQAGWKPKRRIQVPLSTQQVHPDIVNKFRASRRLARLNRDMVVFRR
jgi:predicted transcriptional regulator